MNPGVRSPPSAFPSDSAHRSIARGVFRTFVYAAGRYTTGVPSLGQSPLDGTSRTECNPEHMQRIPTVAAPKALMPSLAGGHAWVYRDQLPREFRARTGQWVRVQAGSFQGFGIWDEDSLIAIRVYSRSAVPDATWVRDRVERAWDLRTSLHSGSRAESETNAFRWIFGEGDGFVGLGAFEAS